MRSLVELVAPITCVACGCACDGELCAVCAGEVSVLGPPWCSRCGSPTEGPTDTCAQCRDLEGFRMARSLVSFVEPSRRLTLSLKRRGRTGLAYVMGELLFALAEREGLAGADVITWVPGGAGARRAGFDHCRSLARGVARSAGLSHRPLLVRAIDGPRQADVSMSERRSNVRGRFASPRAEGRVLLIDDVFTTGATAETCSTILIEAGAESVDVLTWAKTLRRDRNILAL